MTTSPRPQEILRRPPAATIFLVLEIDQGGEDTVRDLLSDVSNLLRATGFRSPVDDLNCIVGIGSRLWDRMFDAPKPAKLHPFKTVVGETHTAPSTPGDLLFHIRAERLDLCFELAHHFMERLKGVSRVVDEVHGFRYFDERDLLGFVDGAENPTGVAAEASVFIGEEDAEHQGGSYVIIQKYLHDLAGWNALTVENQEARVGRHKLSDVEIPDDEKASNSHVVLNTIVDENGVEHDIVRDNMPFGRVGSAEFGTFFIGYAADVTVTETMLERMFIGVPPGNHDGLLDFSTAVTGCLFYVPTADFLDDPPPGPAASATSAAGTQDPAEDSAPSSPSEAAPAADSDGSLGIGSMRKGDS
ncbi:Dyp-type peroxidase [Nocardioides sp. GXZ039]|uniref:Dyp-type peroxidase n=1 Tax=Nocardioides sp. GXZ039 TaxID=3136018 RepID=UPI0030F47F95